jgi:hypothetical protein
MPTVAIIGNDAVLAAAPATPVQLAHACLQRGFTVAVPASWGDELVATESVRRLASRERGPAVMCVCPFVRSRLLTPGPDLAPFLVSLVSPPVATARYVRAAYGDTPVHVTYIGSCPGADDAAIDERLTPDAFIADLAEHGVALGEQPLVFDSIVPPDRRRWCSLPGGVPTAEVLWSETDTRALIEIDPDDVSTDLAQHIITREHVLLDLAPSLGCACSGAVGSLPPRSARVAVTSLEPPRALGPIMDQGVVVSLELPVRRESPAQSEPVTGTPATPPEASAASHSERSHDVLDEMLGTRSTATVDDFEIELEAELDADLASGLMGPVASAVLEASIVAAPQPTIAPAPTSALVVEVAAPTDVQIRIEVQTEVAPSIEQSDAGDSVGHDAPPDRARRHGPVTGVTRYPAAAIPRANVGTGRPLPRAYIAKRRTPTAGFPAVVATPPASVETPPAVATVAPNVDASPATPLAAAADAAQIVDAQTQQGITAESAPSPEPEPRTDGRVARSEQTRGGTVAASETNPTTLIVVLIALLTLSFFVLRSLG